jgi:hypothetical protein
VPLDVKHREGHNVTSGIFHDLKMITRKYQEIHTEECSTKQQAWTLRKTVKVMKGKERGMCSN